MNRSSSNRNAEILGSWASWLIPLLVYLGTIAPLVTAGDAGEFVVAVSRFSLPHPPGYPLYILLLKIWSVLPLGFGSDPLAFKTNLFSAVCMAVTCGFFYRLARMLTGSAAASLAATLLLAFSRTPWKFAVVTEVYGLNMLITVLLLYGLAIAKYEAKRWGLVLASLAFGLGLAHHNTILLFIPLVIGLWPRGRSVVKIPRGNVAVCILAPLLLYLLIPVLASRTPQYAGGFTVRDFSRIVTRSEYRERAAMHNPAEEQLIRPRDVLTRMARTLGEQFGWILLAIGVLGWLFAPSGKRSWAFWGAVTVLIWIISLGFFSRGSPLGMPFNYLRSVDEFLIPVNLFVALGIAWLFAPLALVLTSQADFAGTEGQNFIPPKIIPVTIMLLLCVIPLFLAVVNFKCSSMSHHTFAQDQARNVLEQTPAGGVLVVSGDESFLFEYLQEVRKINPDVQLVVYPMSIVVDGVALPPANSLAYFIDKQLGDRTCMFSFSPPATILPFLEIPRALRLDGVAYTLIPAAAGQPEFTIGDPAIWLKYQLRNLDPVTLGSMVPDDFEFETFDRYVNGLRASVAKLTEDGYGRDEATVTLGQMADFLAKTLDRMNYSLYSTEPNPQEEDPVQ
jgi:hypothetical protein